MLYCWFAAKLLRALCPVVYSKHLNTLKKHLPGNHVSFLLQEGAVVLVSGGVESSVLLHYWVRASNLSTGTFQKLYFSAVLS